MPNPFKKAIEDAVTPIYGDEQVRSERVEVSAVHVPGAALETETDRAARESKTAEAVADPAVPQPPEYEGIDTRDPAANLATRGNIVPDGPGTVATFLT